MAELKTQRTNQRAEEFLKTIEPEEKLGKHKSSDRKCRPFHSYFMVYFYYGS